MKRTQLKMIMMVMGALLLLELIILLSMIYFAGLPFFLFLFTLGLRIVSIALLGFIVVFIVFTALGIRPELTIEWCRAHVRYYTTKHFAVIFISIAALMFSIISGAALAIITENFFLLPIMKKLNLWILTNIK